MALNTQKFLPGSNSKSKSALVVSPKVKSALVKVDKPKIKADQESDPLINILKKTILINKNIESIIDQSNTVLWNGPAGYFENKDFSIGTLAIAKKISENTEKKSLISILGGGDTIAAINKNNDRFSFTHLSTAGGAFLEFLEGKDLPGLNVLK